MPYKPTGRPVGRPLKDEPRFLTYSFKADPALMDAAKEYAWQHRTSVGELIRDGLRWRLEEDSNPLAYRYVTPPTHEKNGNIIIPTGVPAVPLEADAPETIARDPAPTANQPASAPVALEPVEEAYPLPEGLTIPKGCTPGPLCDRKSACDWHQQGYSLWREDGKCYNCRRPAQA